MSKNSVVVDEIIDDLEKVRGIDVVVVNEDDKIELDHNVVGNIEVGIY